MHRHFNDRITAALLLVVTTLSGLPSAQAEGGMRYAVTPASPAYLQECAACHIAYPPSMLPAASWQRLMSNLPRHFGTDASLDAATAQEISAWLRRNADTRQGLTAPPEDRITRSVWFLRKHDEVPADTWKRASIKSAANCSACHSRAPKGDFDEDHVRIPR